MDEPFIGSIATVGFNYAPYGWAFCDGRIMPIAQNTALFSLLGTTFGGDGKVTFGLPDLRGRVAIGVGTGPGLTNRVWGEQGGENSVTLLVTQIPSHAHNAGLPSNATTLGNTPTPSSSVGYSVTPADSGGDPIAIYGPSDGTTKLTATIGITGGSQPHQNIQPSLGMNYIIALQGLFPTRP